MFEISSSFTPESGPDAGLGNGLRHLPPVELQPLQESLPSLETEPPFKYKLLVGHRRTDGTFKTGDQLRTEYLQRTDKLIYQMTEGVEVRDPVTNASSIEVPDDVVFLDKSARPLAWLVNEMWDEYAADESGVVPPKPDLYFANIDRQQWVNIVDPQGVGAVDMDLVDTSIIRSLRSIYVEPKYKRIKEDGTGGLDESIDTAPADLDDKTVLIVDEVNSSGRTLTIAEKFYREAFPTAKIATTHWMGGITSGGANAQATGNVDLPVWYKKKSVYGRGVGDRNPDAENTHNITQKLGSWFLSTPLPKVEIIDEQDPGVVHYENDPLSAQLRVELTHLPHDPNVLKLPHIQRDDFDARAERLNGMTIDDIIAQKKQMDKASMQAQHPSGRAHRIR